MYHIVTLYCIYFISLCRRTLLRLYIIHTIVYIVLYYNIFYIIYATITVALYIMWYSLSILYIHIMMIKIL